MFLRNLEVESQGVAKRREHSLPEASGVGGLRRPDRRLCLQPLRGGQREDAKRRQVAARTEEKVGKDMKYQPELTE